MYSFLSCLNLITWFFLFLYYKMNDSRKLSYLSLCLSVVFAVITLIFLAGGV